LEERLANNKYGGGLIYTPAPVAACAPSAAVCAQPHSNTRLFRPAFDVAPVRTQIRVSIAMVVPDSPSTHARTLCSRPQPRAHEEFAPSSTSPCPVLRVRASSLCPVAHVCAHSHAFALKRLCPHPRPDEESVPSPTRPRLESVPGPTHPRLLPRIRAQRGRAFTSECTCPTARVTSARPQSFPAGAPSSRMHP
jgi:hypothetical protein